ncbi:hypothetical protein [Bradyrhizobium centrolobii]|uniref:hypothetical protein n=1 Tax=Bradyrhizobium centrolobii TaxID=1505087 RepID=UPI0010A96089|nr:hypothetical protein [Bradyrhizobium centrolobii]
MKTALLVTAILAVGAVSANAGNDQRHGSSLNHNRHHIESAVMAVGAPAGGSIDERPAWTLYRQNLHDSGYDAKKNMDSAGHMCVSCDYRGN